MEVTYTEHKSTFKNDVIQFLVYNISWGGIVFFSSKSIYKFGLSVCLFVSNKRQNGWTDRAQIFCGTSRDHREGLRMIKKNLKMGFKGF